MGEGSAFAESNRLQLHIYEKIAESDYFEF